MINFKSEFKNKKIIITGHTGLKGSWLTAILISYGAKVIGISDNTIKNSHLNYLKIKNKIKDLRVDIRNEKKINFIFKKIKPDYVFHLAAQSLVPKSISYPSLTWTTNVIGTFNILNALKNKKKGKCVGIIITSDKCYFNTENKFGYSEKDILGGEDPYSASKASAEYVFYSQFHTYFKHLKNIRIASVRAGNVIGGGDWSLDRLIPDLIRSYKSNKKVKIRSINSIRPWQHVLEPLFGYLKLAVMLNKKRGLSGQSFNFGPKINNFFTVGQLIKEINKNLKTKQIKVITKKSNFKESKVLRLKIEKAKKILKWVPLLDFENSIKLTIEWYLNYFKKRILTFDQIENYKKILIK